MSFSPALSDTDYLETYGWDSLAAPPVPWLEPGAETGESLIESLTGATNLAQLRAHPLEAVHYMQSHPGGGWLSGAVHSVGRTLGGVAKRVGSVATSVVKKGLPAVGKLISAPAMLSKTISASGFSAMRALASGNPKEALQVIRSGAAELSSNPAWQIAQSGAAFIPGVGTAVSAGMAGAAALGRGESLEDAALSAARGALPGGPLAQAAFDAAVGVARGQSLSDAALGAVREQVPGGAIGKAAFDAGITLARRGAMDPDMASVVRDAVPPEGRDVFDRALGAAAETQSDTGNFGFELPAHQARIAQAMWRQPQIHTHPMRRIARDNNVSVRDAQSAAAAMLRKWAPNAEIRWHDVGDMESCEGVANRLQIPQASRVTLTRRAPARRQVRVNISMPRSLVLRLHQHGSAHARKAIARFGVLPRIARDTGELTGPTTWTIRSGDFPSGVAQKVTGNGARWKEILAANPSYTTYTDSNGSTQIRPWAVGQTFQVPASWVGSPAAPPKPGVVISPPQSLPPGTPPPTPPSTGNGPPFPPPSIYPAGYPSSTYTVVTGDTGSVIAKKITGNELRWRELLATNPAKASAQYGIAVYTGDVLRLPQSWQRPFNDVIPVPPGVRITPVGPQEMGPPPPQVVGTQQQIILLAAMLSTFHARHPEAGLSLSPPYGSDVSDMSGLWSARTQAATRAFQVWANARGKSLPTDGMPDPATTAALQAQLAADLPAALPPTANTPPIPGINPTTVIPPVIPGGIIPGGIVPPGGIVVPPIPGGVVPPTLSPPVAAKSDSSAGAIVALLGLAAALA